MRLIGAAISEPHLRAAGRQGLDELGEALKAFPDSIQKTELGGIFTPTPAEVAQQHGVFGPDIDHSEGKPLQQDPVSAALDSGRAGQSQPAQESQQERGSAENPVTRAMEAGGKEMGGKAAKQPAQEQQQEHEASDRNPVEEVLDAGRGADVGPEPNQMEQSQELDHSR